MSYFRELVDQVPDLFPGVGKYTRAPYDQREYVTRELVRLAQEGKLSVMQVMNQEDDGVAELAGQIILGHQFNIDTGGLTADAPIPPELREYRVWVRSIEYERADPDDKGKIIKNKRTISWKEGFRMAGMRRRNRAQIPFSEPNRIDTGAYEKDLLLQDAWRCLKQAGAWCRRLNSTRLRRRQWYFEEVFPHPDLKEKKAGGKANN